MNDHPSIVTLPQAIWSFSGAKPEWRESYDTWACREIKRVLARGRNEPLQTDVLGLVPYRPELLMQIGPSVLSHPALREKILAHPVCALSLLIGFYEDTADTLEPCLDGSGECVYHLLRWVTESGRTLRRPESFYRRVLTVDSYWGFLHAKQTNNASLLSDVIAWCADERHNYAAAAAFFLLRHPEEQVAPYRDVLAAHPFYAYLSLPRLSLRGFTILPEHIGPVPKWACHFAWSAFPGRRDEFIALAAADPAWMIELASGLGWLAQPAKLPSISQTIATHGNGHPLQRPAMRFLVDVKQAGHPP